MTQLLNVKDFGATGDGHTDDTLALQLAIDSAAQVKGTAFFPEGIYACSTLKTHDHVGLLGNPAWSYYVTGGPTLKLINPNAPCLLDITMCRGVRINGLCLIGEKLGQQIHGIWASGPKREREDFPALERCCIQEFSGDGIRLDDIWCFSLRGCAIGKNGGSGLAMHGADGYILDNWFSNNKGAGINAAIGGTGSMTITANRIEWNQGGGLVVAGAWQYNITGNYFDRCGGPGLLLTSMSGDANSNGCYNFAITGNVFNRSGKPEWTSIDSHLDCNVSFSYCRGLVFTGNSICAGQDDNGKGLVSPSVGIIIKNLKDSVIANNVLYKGATKELIIDNGEHEGNVLVNNNMGSLVGA